MVKNIAGGFQKGESVYVIDSEMALYAEDIGKDGVFIPDKMASEIDYLRRERNDTYSWLCKKIRVKDYVAS